MKLRTVERSNVIVTLCIFVWTDVLKNLKLDERFEVIKLYELNY